MHPQLTRQTTSGRGLYGGAMAYGRQEPHPHTLTRRPTRPHATPTASMQRSAKQHNVSRQKLRRHLTCRHPARLRLKYCSEDVSLALSRAIPICLPSLVGGWNHVDNWQPRSRRVSNCKICGSPRLSTFHNLGVCGHVDFTTKIGEGVGRCRPLCPRSAQD